MLNIAFPVNLEPSFQSLIPDIVTAVQSFKKYGVAVFHQPPDHGFRFPAGNNIGLEAESRSPSDLALVIMYFLAILIKFIGTITAGVLKAVKMDPDASLM